MSSSNSFWFVYLELIKVLTSRSKAEKMFLFFQFPLISDFYVHLKKLPFFTETVILLFEQNVSFSILSSLFRSEIVLYLSIYFFFEFIHKA